MAIPSTANASGAEAHVYVGPEDSIQAAIDAAEPGVPTTIEVRGDHVENLWIGRSGISLVGKRGASITMPEVPAPSPCSPDFVATLICVIPASILEVDPPPPEAYLDDVGIQGFTLTNPLHDAIGMVFTNNVYVKRNTIVDPGCDGIFVIFSTGFNIHRNTVSGAQCAGINVGASMSGEISRNDTSGSLFNGIAVNDTSQIVIDRNTASGNCVGIGVVDGADGGYGIRDEDFPGRDITIRRNTTNGNNSVCFPFTPDIPIGVVGIIAAGVTDVLIHRNTANDNVSTEFTVTAAGIFVPDFPNEDGTETLTMGARVTRNTATGNSSAAGPVDLFMPTAGGVELVRDNHCGFSVPDPSWCS